MARRGDGATSRWTMRRFLGGLAVLLLAGALVAPSGTVYDAHGRRQGYVKESRPGQVRPLRPAFPPARLRPPGPRRDNPALRQEQLAAA